MASDNFNTGSVLSASWTTTDGSFVLDTSGVCVNDAGRSLAYWDADSFPNDQWSEITIAALGYRSLGPAVRCQPSDAGGYAYQSQGIGGVNELIRTSTSGVATTLGTGVNAAASQTLRLEITGTSLVSKVNGTEDATLGTKTDATYSSGSAGISGEYNGTDSRGDDWSGGGFSTLTQAAFRWRDDDDDENSAAWLAAQSTTISRVLDTNTRLRFLLQAALDPPTTVFQLEWNRAAADAVWRKAETPDATAIAYGTIGAATTTGTTAPTVAYPASIAKGDLLILSIVNRPSSSTPSTPSGWTALTNYTQTGGIGSDAADAGNVRITVFTKEAAGTESGNLTLAITSGTSCGARMIRYTKGAGKVWSLAAVNGTDTSNVADTWDITGGADPGIAAGDIVLVASGINSDHASSAMGSEALTATGVTAWGTVTERTDTAVSTGNDCRLVITDHPVTTGTSSAAPVYYGAHAGDISAITGGNAGGGAAIILRIRQSDAPIVLSPSSQIPAGGATATTQQLTGGTDAFLAGTIADDTNPMATLDITTDDYTELEWCIKAQSPATTDDVYQFRVTKAGVVLDTYTVTPEWTIDSGTPPTGNPWYAYQQM